MKVTISPDPYSLAQTRCPTPGSGPLEELGRAPVTGLPPWAWPVIDAPAARYAAGIRSLLERADMRVTVLGARRRWAPGPYRDYDLVLTVQVGSLSPYTLRGRRALATLRFGLHVANSGRVDWGGLRDVPVPEGELCVLPSGEGSTEASVYELRPQDADALARRVLMQLFAELVVSHWELDEEEADGEEDEPAADIVLSGWDPYEEDEPAGEDDEDAAGEA